jgi:predicted cupin superfamily sugar epimerase
MKDAEYWIENLGLQPHPEGGFFKETYRSKEIIPKSALPERFEGDRVFSTCIYFLLKGDEFSAFHRIKQDELWHFYDGSPLTVHIIDAYGAYSKIILGKNPEQGESLQTVVRAGCYFAAETNNKESFSLVGCTVAPGFDFADLEMPSRAALIDLFPEHAEIVENLTGSQLKTHHE